MKQSLLLRTACALSGLSLAVTVQASGFRLPESSAAGLSLSNALVANPDAIGALHYNPAAMSFHTGNNVSAGLSLIRPDLKVTPATGIATKSQGRKNVFTPNGYFMGQLQGEWTWGLGLSVPFGLDTVWPAGTFPQFAGALAALAPKHSEIDVLNINPNVARRLSAHTSIAFGVDFYQASTLTFSTQGVPIDGTGTGTGFNAALLHQAGPWSFGASYRSQVSVDINGEVGGAPATTSITFPSMLQVGARYKVNPALAMEFDIERTGWSSFDNLIITAPLAPSPANRIVSTNHWKDSNAYRLGASYQLTPRTQLRFGYALDQTPQPNAWFSARIPGADRNLYSIGIAHKMGSWSLEAGYMYVKFKDRTINSATNYPTQAAGGNIDPNGTSAYNGTYKSSVDLFAIGVTKHF